MQQYKTGTLGAPAGGRLLGAIRSGRKWLEALGYAAGGLIMSAAGIFGGISPFGAAFCAAAGGGSAAAALGSVVGYIVSPDREANMKYVAAVLLVAAAKWLFAPKRSGILGKDLVVRQGAAASIVIVFFAMMVSGAAAVFSSYYTLYDLILNLSEVFIACGATYFFTRALSSMRARWSGASKADISCAVVSFAVIITGLEGLELYGVSVGRALSVLAILLCARYGGEAGSAVAGIVAGLAVSLAGGDIGYAVAAYAFGGLVAGVFGGVGRVATAASFIVVNAAVALLTQDSVSVYYSLIEAFAASVIFMIVPSSLLSRLRPERTESGAENSGYAHRILRDRLSEISLALSEIGTTTRRVSEELGKLDEGGSGEAAARVVDIVCRKCPMKSTCWQFSRAETMEAMNSALSSLRRLGSLNRAHAPKYFTENCCKLDDLLMELNSQFQSYNSRKGAERKVSQVRSVLTDQFESLSMMMSEIAGEICAVRAFDVPKAKRVRDYFEKEGISADRVQVYTDESERMCVTFTMPNYQVAKLHRAKSALDMCGLLEAEFDLPQITARGRYATVVYMEKALFTVEFGAYQIAGNGNRLCGDAYDYIKNRTGKAHFILSDGMGSGGSAAVDSSMASGLIQQLLSVGVSHEAALKMVNSALMIKSGDESLATLDITTVDLFTGRTDFYKAGAAPTYLLKNGRAGYVESSSLPAGILRGVSFEHNVTALRENDVIFMVSDGVTASGTDWVKSEIEGMRSLDVQRMCEKLAVTAKERRSDNREDDITVLAAVLRQAG